MVKYPRLIVSLKRHTKLHREALRRMKAGEPNATMEQVGEEMFKKAEQN